MRILSAITCSLATGLIGLSMLIGSAPEAFAQRSGTILPQDPRARTMTQMGRPVTVELADTPLEDIMSFIEEVTGAPLDVKWRDDRASGLDRDTEVSIKVEGVSMLSFLERVLEKAQIDTFDENTWQLTETGELEIGPKSRLNASKRLELYDVNDLLYEIPSFTNFPTLDLDSVLNQSQGGGSSGSIFDEEETEGERLTREQKIQELIDIIITSVEPEQWVDNGGDAATVREYRGTLMIRAPDYIHRQLVGYSFALPPARPLGAQSSRMQEADEASQRRLAERQRENEENSDRADQSPDN